MDLRNVGEQEKIFLSMCLWLPSPPCLFPRVSSAQGCFCTEAGGLQSADGLTGRLGCGARGWGWGMGYLHHAGGPLWGLAGRQTCRGQGVGASWASGTRSGASGACLQPKLTLLFPPVMASRLNCPEVWSPKQQHLLSALPPRWLGTGGEAGKCAQQQRDALAPLKILPPEASPTLTGTQKTLPTGPQS